MDSYSSSTGRVKKLLFEKTSPKLLSDLQNFLDSVLNNTNLEDMDIADFHQKLFTSLGWKLYDS